MLDVSVCCCVEHNNHVIFLNKETKVPEIRASLSSELHRKLKAEAAREGVHLKDLIARILEEHVKEQKGVGRS